MQLVFAADATTVVAEAGAGVASEFRYGVAVV